jgi:hypothetical protein
MGPTEYAMWIPALGLWCLVAIVLAVRLGRAIGRSSARITDADHIRVLSRRSRANVA